MVWMSYCQYQFCGNSVSQMEKDELNGMLLEVRLDTSEISEELDNLCSENNKKDNEIYSHSAYKLEDLKENHIIIADGKLLDESKK